MAATKNYSGCRPTCKRWRFWRATLPVLLFACINEIQFFHHLLETSAQQPYAAGTIDAIGKNSGFFHQGLPPRGVKSSPDAVMNGTKGMNWKEICNVFPGHGPEGMWGYQAIRNIHRNESAAALRLLCIVYTHSNRGSLLKAVRATYGKQCDGFVAFSNETNPSLGTVGLLKGPNFPAANASPLSVAFPDEAGVLSEHDIWKHVFEHYQNFDLFHFGGDDMYVIPANIRALAANKILERQNSASENEPHWMYMGSPVAAGIEKKGSSKFFQVCGLAAGYTLNQESIKKMIETCPRPSMGFRLRQDGPVMYPQVSDSYVASCMMGLRVPCESSTNDVGIYHLVDAHRMAFSNGVPEPLRQNRKLFQKHFRRTLGFGLKKISSFSASFSLRPQTSLSSTIAVEYMLRRYHAIIHDRCDEVWNRPLGALDAQGNSGYIHNPKGLREAPPLPFTYYDKGDNRSVCLLPFGEDEEGRKGYQGLTKVRVMDNPETSKKTVLCLVYTHAGRHARVRAIAETWGRRCDGFMAASNATNAAIGAVNLLHEGPEEYSNMWEKIRAIWRYTYDHYIDDFDYFFLSGDDTYVIAENLHHVLETGSWKGQWNESAPLLFGAPMVDTPYRSKRYCGGGSGYVLNRVALKLMVEKLLPREPDCWAHFKAPDEDRIVGSCFRTVGLQCMDTNDHLNETRFHVMSADFHAGWTLHKREPWFHDGLLTVHGIDTTKTGLGQISETSVSFHLKRRQGSKFRDGGLRRYHAIMYGMCSNVAAN